MFKVVLNSEMANRMISLKSSDGEIFDVEEALTLQSNIIKLMLEEVITNSGVIIPVNVSSNILVKMIEYWKHDAVSEANNPKDFDEEYFNEMSCETILEIKEAAKYLDAERLYEVCSRMVFRRLFFKTNDIRAVHCLF